MNKIHTPPAYATSPMSIWPQTFIPALNNVAFEALFFTLHLAAGTLFKR